MLEDLAAMTVDLRQHGFEALCNLILDLTIRLETLRNRQQSVELVLDHD
jgi:hypothetical protein